MRVLGIESSCDETSAAVVDGNGRTATLRSLAILSQDVHAIFGGVVPEIAARAHVEALDRIIAKAMADAALKMLDVDPVGFDVMDRNLLEAVLYKFNGGPVGLDNLAAAIGEDPDTIEEVYEPFLVMHGFLQRTARGRVASAQAYRHLGFTPPQRDQASLF